MSGDRPTKQIAGVTSPVLVGGEMNAEETILFVGRARAPDSAVAAGSHGEVHLELEVAPDTTEVVDAHCSIASPLTSRLLLEVLLGHRLNQSIELPVRAIRRRYFGPDQRAIITALENAYKGYERYCKSRTDDSV